MKLSDKEIMNIIYREFGDDLVVCTKEEMKESIKNFLSSYKPIEHEIDKSALEYTKEEIELLKKSYINSTTEERIEFEHRRDLLFNDGSDLTHLLYKAMTIEEKNKMLRIKHMENQPLFEEEKAKKEEAERIAKEKEEKQGYETGITYDQLSRTPDTFLGKKLSLKEKFYR